MRDYTRPVQPEPRTPPIHTRRPSPRADDGGMQRTGPGLRVRATLGRAGFASVHQVVPAEVVSADVPIDGERMHRTIAAVFSHGADATALPVMAEDVIEDLRAHLELILPEVTARAAELQHGAGPNFAELGVRCARYLLDHGCAPGASLTAHAEQLARSLAALLAYVSDEPASWR